MTTTTHCDECYTDEGPFMVVTYSRESDGLVSDSQTFCRECAEAFNLNDATLNELFS